jgi:hypothetical protein
MKRVRQNLGEPHQSRLNTASRAKPEGAKEQSSKTKRQPEDAKAIKERIALEPRKHSPKCRIEQQKQRHRNPHYKQHHFSLQIESNLHFFLMAERYIIDAVETLWLEKEMPNLARPHRHSPPKEACCNRFERQKDVADQKTESAEKVQALGNPALVVETVVVPALLL